MDTGVFEPAQDSDMLDSLTIGRRIRQLRAAKGMTLDDLSGAIGRAPSQLSVIENGKRELKLGELQRLSRALGVTMDELLTPEAPSKRAALEIALERAQRGPLYATLGLPPLPVRKSLSNEAIETILGLHTELQRLHGERALTPEEARRANTELRRAMRARNNYFPELEKTARELLKAVGHDGGPLSQRVASDLASHLGFSLHYVHDLPTSTRSVTDLANGRIYLPVTDAGGTDQRSTLLQALASQVLQISEPTDYADFLRQRVETNYLAGALMVPEASAMAFLKHAKDKRELSVEDLRDAFA
ncbi:MAG: family transcriptional regulator, fatty acid utilization regulator, partial [Actinomycetota bacterium]|nr:family transcriptional regulator, fatty acid utilization regulator [Actinomycetota bacterium]